MYACYYLSIFFFFLTLAPGLPHLRCFHLQEWMDHHSCSLHWRVSNYIEFIIAFRDTYRLMTNEGTYIMIPILRNNRTSVGSLSIVAGEHSLSVDSGNEQTRNIAAKHEYKLSDIYLKHKFIFFFFYWIDMSVTAQGPRRMTSVFWRYFDDL